MFKEGEILICTHKVGYHYFRTYSLVVAGRGNQFPQGKGTICRPLIGNGHAQAISNRHLASIHSMNGQRALIRAAKRIPNYARA